MRGSVVGPGRVVAVVVVVVVVEEEEELSGWKERRCW